MENCVQVLSKDYTLEMFASNNPITEPALAFPYNFGRDEDGSPVLQMKVYPQVPNPLLRIT